MLTIQNTFEFGSWTFQDSPIMFELPPIPNQRCYLSSNFEFRWFGWLFWSLADQLWKDLWCDGWLLLQQVVCGKARDFLLVTLDDLFLSAASWMVLNSEPNHRVSKSTGSLGREADLLLSRLVGYITFRPYSGNFWPWINTKQLSSHCPIGRRVHSWEVSYRILTDSNIRDGIHHVDKLKNIAGVKHGCSEHHFAHKC